MKKIRKVRKKYNRESGNLSKIGKVAQLFVDEFKQLNIKPLPDAELHQLLVKAIKENDKEARNKVLLHIMPIILNKTKKYFQNGYIVETMDFIQEVAYLVLDHLFKHFRIDEQEEGRCALFMKTLDFYFLYAFNEIKKKYLKRKTDDEVNYKEIFNGCAEIADLDESEWLDYTALIEENQIEIEPYTTSEYAVRSAEGNLEQTTLMKEIFERIYSKYFSNIGLSVLIYCQNIHHFGTNLISNYFLKHLERNLFKWINLHRQELLYGQ